MSQPLTLTNGTLKISGTFTMTNRVFLTAIYVIPATGGPPTDLADTHDGFGRHSELVGWSDDGGRLYFTEVHGTSMRLLALPSVPFATPA